MPTPIPAAAIAFLATTAAMAQSAPQAAAPRSPDLVLTGTITGEDHQSFVERSFHVPADVDALSVDFSYDRSTKTVIDIGLFDDQRFRGWSGGNKARFTIGATSATPSYVPGPVSGRDMTLLLGIPNARPRSRTSWRAEIRFDRGPRSTAMPPLRSGSGWYRGDLHSHSGHSDGNCANDAGARVPCPLYRSVTAAAAAGLDFIAMTEHNTVSHMPELAALQPAFSKLLLIPGQEVTTFFGHANVLGPTALAEFRLGTPMLLDASAFARATSAIGGLVSVNHPGLPSGEACMGCGWTLQNTDWSAVSAIEIVNGGAVAAGSGRIDTPLSGVPFWEKLLSAGHMLTPIAGSDNHDAGLISPDPRAIGTIATVVWATALSTADILAGIRNGRVFVDADSAKHRTLDLFALTPAGKVPMGGSLELLGRGEIEFEVTVTRCAGCSVTLVHDGRSMPSVTVGNDDRPLSLQLVAESAGWVRADVRDPAGRLVLIGNAIHFVGPGSAARRGSTTTSR